MQAFVATHLVLSPLELIEKLVALVPPPRLKLVPGCQVSLEMAFVLPILSARRNCRRTKSKNIATSCPWRSWIVVVPLALASPTREASSTYRSVTMIGMVSGLSKLPMSKVTTPSNASVSSMYRKDKGQRAGSSKWRRLSCPFAGRGMMRLLEEGTRRAAEENAA